MELIEKKVDQIKNFLLAGIFTWVGNANVRKN